MTGGAHGDCYHIRRARRLLWAVGAGTVEWTGLDWTGLLTVFIDWYSAKGRRDMEAGINQQSFMGVELGLHGTGTVVRHSCHSDGDAL